MQIFRKSVLAAGVVLLVAAVAASGSSAADPEPPVIEITWDGIAGLVDAHPLLSEGAQRVAAAQGAVDAAGALPNPVLEGVVGRGREQPGEAYGRQWDLSLTLPLDWMAQRTPRVAAAAAELAVAAAEGETIKRDALLELRTQFWRLVHDQARVGVVGELDLQMADLAAAVDRRVEAGEARPLERTRVGIERELVADELQTARISLASRQAQLALWLGAPAGARIVAVADLEALPLPPDADVAATAPAADHPELVAGEARVRALTAELSAAKRARVPAFSLMAFTSREQQRRAHGAGIAVDVPLWNWNRGGVAQAQAQLAAGRSREEVRRRTLAATIVEAAAACRASLATASRYAAGVVPRAADAAAVVEKTYLLGEASLLEVIDARRTLLASRRQLLDALAQAQIDHCRLRALTGEENP
ncbi:MAG: TolC family protein [Candidatus Latescibacteria bacterium]|nr:TolC family protein [Candidatus Latescibacterota bacterium]